MDKLIDEFIKWLEENIGWLSVDEADAVREQLQKLVEDARKLKDSDD